MALQPDGRIVAAGLGSPGGRSAFALARYDGGALPPPSLTVAKEHTGSFVRGETGTYTITAGNRGPGPTDGSTVTVHDTLPPGLTATAIGGSGWQCALATLTCVRDDVLGPGDSYPPITLTVHVPCDAPASGVNTATVTGGGDSTTHTAADPTAIVAGRHCGKPPTPGKPHEQVHHHEHHHLHFHVHYHLHHHGDGRAPEGSR
ncbi:hypothetical protein NPS70_00055 [Streptomyces sp. C10-9-1]|uniref:hypothetical protein n=1 Tax=Streptomyces sp. C10-9-1 TaxID=1859285 RepID=UPI002113330B|nr:hypothetical protein [Streptomyces sp. C10-9-1]MCQ6551601.1 hypothetical protein [Streptomyces sp. C10-9-1]